MGNYDFKSIEKKWQVSWREKGAFRAEKHSDKPKYYVLDMFPYPSGSGLHVGHPLGYVTTDIVARYKRMCGFNVLHPMGFDAFGLPAEQYALETGTHPAVSTMANIMRFQEQLTLMGLGFDPETTDLKSCDASYYKWTQWIFLQIFNSWFNLDTQKAEPVSTLIGRFETGGSAAANAFGPFGGSFSAAEWNGWSDEQRYKTLLDFRLAYTAYATVNWCPALGTVLANDEVINGVSERGGHPVERKPMRQWAFRMTAYADRLLAGLNTIDWPDAIKEHQRNWIGRSEGSSIIFDIAGSDQQIEVFSTRPDTLFGSTFMVLAPEHDLLNTIVPDALRDEVNKYTTWARNRSEVERQQEVKKVTGIFTGAYAMHPFTGKQIPIWTADYVLAGYGTGAIMAVPAHDERDFAFAKHFGIDIVQVVEGGNIAEEANEAKTGKMMNSDFLNGLEVKAAITRMIEELGKHGRGKARVNYRLRDPNFSRQRYWGEPIPIVFRNDLPYALPEAELPLVLPDTNNFHPGETGESPLSRLTGWVNLPDGSRRETNTMPGYAGSSWYWLRYFDPGNDKEFAAKQLCEYWENVDLYIGGAEHAVGHLLYSRFWNKVMFDLGLITKDEPFQKLVNQGMIQGRSSIAYRIKGSNTFVSAGLRSQHDTDPIHVNVSLVENDVLNIPAFKAWREEYANAEFMLEGGVYKCGYQVEKMSKRYGNVVTPDEICDKYGADTFRLYEMFLGPLEVSKPYDLNGIEGVFRFLRKLHNHIFDDANNLLLTDEAPTADELRVLHQTIKKTGEDIDRLSLNTSVAQFMIFTNEVIRLGCRKRSIIVPFIQVLSPFAPHFAEEVWLALGNSDFISKAAWPEWKEEYLKENSFEYPIQVNGKMRGKLTLPADLSKEQIEKEALAAEEVQKVLAGATVKKMIVVPGRIINLVV